MAYEYDVFLSYRRVFPFGAWVDEHFLPFFRPFLEGALNRSPRIFVDRSGIRTGDAWPERLQQALGFSRCMVAIWSPLYFNSEWCRRECAVMIHREQQLGFHSLGNPGGLVLPVCVFDGEHFPEIARRRQSLDCRRFFVVGDGFKKTELYVEFQQVVAGWSADVARAISHAPPWSSDLSSRRWLRAESIDLAPRVANSFPFPGLE